MLPGFILPSPHQRFLVETARLRTCLLSRSVARVFETPLVFDSLTSGDHTKLHSPEWLYRHPRSTTCALFRYKAIQSPLCLPSVCHVSTCSLSPSLVIAYIAFTPVFRYTHSLIAYTEPHRLFLQTCSVPSHSKSIDYNRSPWSH